ncbi:MAG TPA: serine hydrolase domain-containing protein [Abditibacteriaceae bacterium]|jgi:CubicO group peptidase (beta-lactamase class C family)
MNELSAIFAEASASRTFPGGTILLARGETIVAHQSFGTTAYDNTISRAVTLDTIYDIASLSKLFTASAFLIAAREQGIPLESPLARFFPEFASLEPISLLDLLRHTNGLQMHVQELCAVGPEEWPRRIADAGLVFSPGTSVRYTCTAYVLLGWIIEKLVGSSLEVWVQNRLIQPLGLKRTTYNAAQKLAPEEIAPTEIGESGEPWRGVVHDEASRALGGIAGNAGIFSTAEDLGTFAQMWLNNGVFNGREILHRDDVTRALTDAVQGEGFRQAIAWHLDVSSWMSAGAPRGTAGHLGFTGPSLFIVPETKHICIVLNNRVYPTRNGPARLRFHRRIAEWLFAHR